ncbi:hypothetical protein MCOR27_002325 [Pyricularia oryzae]|uniref:WSC domain-containing protein n=1 Tax=Pyricularia oryzae TaxID=318829 RepID=A0A4P7N974_PYROR|nr:hypothetical protein MCOR02_011390 [Pyricularia oryzae]KAI6282874.1 hypothetical protein MCOR26_002627 [Pyricularia oryzae]KAI6285406.1 hypothetical protein MCOR27_002325 [Pyricularia oryzae]KAI6316413.1 hypothetical protein MCOR34_004367 [Pyricularia oryzae]KAI6347343.1 hypothetical protein MCOR28_002394 [Pyricularia oryzae]
MDETRPREGTSADKTFIPTGQSKQSLLTSPHPGPESIPSPQSGPDAGAAAAAAAASPVMQTYHQQHSGGIEVVHDSYGLHPSCARCNNVSSSQVNSMSEEKIAVVSPHTVAASSWPESNSQTTWNSTASQVPAREKRICGLRPTTLFLSLSNILFVLGLVALGVYHAMATKGGNTNQPVAEAGVCVAPTNNNTTNATSKPSDSRNPNICFDTTTPPAARSQYGVTRADCPRDGDKRYTVPGTNMTFTRTCGIDFKDNDLGWLPTPTMEDCLALCAQLNLYPSSGRGSCLGVTWVFGGTQGEGMSFCYPKYKVDTRGAGGNDKESAILVTGGAA